MNPYWEEEVRAKEAIQYLLDHYKEYNIRIDNPGLIPIGDDYIVQQSEHFYVVSGCQTTADEQALRLAKKLVKACEKEYFKRLRTNKNEQAPISDKNLFVITYERAKRAQEYMNKAAQNKRQQRT